MLTRLRDKNLHTWMRGYLEHLARRARSPKPHGPRHLLFAVCDHYEPLWGKAKGPVAVERGAERVRAWTEGYPQLADQFRDADGRVPRHSFFFPGEEYQPEYLDGLAQLARGGYGEVELHLHHDQQTAGELRADIDRYVKLFGEHGHLGRDSTGRTRYGFIHGNWCLANARRDGRWCGVDDELPLLFETGCYADFTFPSAPDECQPNIVNQIYWPTGDLSRRRAYERGEPARVGTLRDDRILMIEGPLALARKPGRWTPRIESAALDSGDPPTPDRVRTWVNQNIHVGGRPEWVFVKVHTHGAPEANAASLLGDDGLTLHRTLQREFNDGVRWKLHYVTAREMYNLAVAAMNGQRGEPADHFDHAVAPPPVVMN